MTEGTEETALDPLLQEVWFSALASHLHEHAVPGCNLPSSS